MIIDQHVIFHSIPQKELKELITLLYLNFHSYLSQLSIHMHLVTFAVLCWPEANHKSHPHSGEGDHTGHEHLEAGSYGATLESLFIYSKDNSYKLNLLRMSSGSVASLFKGNLTFPWGTASPPPSSRRSCIFNHEPHRLGLEVR